jgi:hypothetical protein
MYQNHLFFQAGLNEVFIIPEAASVFHYCRQYNRLYKSISGRDVDMFSKDKRSIVIDCEGNTFHEKKNIETAGVK